jgi:hypothetical protein
MSARTVSDGWLELTFIQDMSKAARRELGFLLACEGPDFLPGWRLVHSRTGDEPSAVGLCGEEADLWNCVIVPQCEYDIFRRLWLSDARHLTSLKGDPAEHARFLKKLRARLRKVQQRTNASLKPLRRRNRNMAIEPWHGARGRGLRRKGDTGEAPA